MKKSLSHYRLITGIKSHRSNPIVIKKKNHAVAEAAHPEVVERASNTEQFDKDYAFNYIQSRWFRKRLHYSEQITLSADHLKMICDEVHEMGRLLERKSKGCDCPIDH